jgi:hypothetical protein
MPGKMIEFCQVDRGELFYALDSSVSHGHALAVAGLPAGSCNGAEGVRALEVEQVSQPTHMYGAPGEVTLACDRRNGTLLYGGSTDIYGNAQPALAAVANGCDVGPDGAVGVQGMSSAGGAASRPGFTQLTEPTHFDGAPGSLTRTCDASTGEIVYSGDSGTGHGHTLSLGVLPGACAIQRGAPEKASNMGDLPYQPLGNQKFHLLGTPAKVSEYCTPADNALIITGETGYSGGKMLAVAVVPKGCAAPGSHRAPAFKLLTKATSIPGVPGSTSTACDTTHGIEVSVSWSKDKVRKSAGNSLSLAATPGCEGVGA